MDEQHKQDLMAIEALVAERIMGYDLAEHTGHEWEEKLPGAMWCRRCWIIKREDWEPTGPCQHMPEPFTRAWYALGEVIDRMVELGFRNPSLLHNSNRTDGKHWTFVISAPDGPKAWKADGALPGEAVCLASLRAIEEWDGQAAA